MARWGNDVGVLDLKIDGKCEKISEKLHLLSEILPKVNVYLL